MSQRHRDTGFTDAERLAFAWSRRNQTTQVNKDYYQDEDSRPYKRDNRNRDQPNRSICRSRSRSRGRGRDSPTYSPFNGERRNREKPSYSPYRGNESPDNDRSNREARRGRSRTPPRRRLSRSRSRSPREPRGRSPQPSTWKHDKFEDKDADKHANASRRSIPEDYRPPTPTWISRAGGVAIMRKKPSR